MYLDSASVSNNNPAMKTRSQKSNCLDLNSCTCAYKLCEVGLTLSLRFPSLKSG